MSPLERLPRPDPTEVARLEQWLKDFEARRRAAWPAERERVLARAQLAQNMRNKIIG
jgi:hypothetical protein